MMRLAEREKPEHTHAITIFDYNKYGYGYINVTTFVPLLKLCFIEGEVVLGFSLACTIPGYLCEKFSFSVEISKKPKGFSFGIVNEYYPKERERESLTFL